MKIIRQIAAASLISFMIACTGTDNAKPVSLASKLMIDLAEWQADPPEQIKLDFFWESSAQAVISDPSQITELIDSLSDITVLDETDTLLTDSDTFITLVFSDGSSTSIAFNGSDLSFSGKNYETEGTERLFALLKKAAAQAEEAGTPPAG